MCYCSYTNSFISDLSYVTCTDPILQLNLNNKKQLKFDKLTNFFHKNLNKEKFKNVPVPPPYLITFYALLLSLHNFSSFVIHQSHTLVGYHTIGINFMSILFLHALYCLYLLHQIISLTRTIIARSSSWKLSSSKLKEL